MGVRLLIYDLNFFKHYREVEHRDGSRETKWASMQKTIYSLPALRELLEAAKHATVGPPTSSWFHSARAPFSASLVPSSGVC